MSQHYSNPSRESDTYALPDVEVFQLTAREVAESADYSELVDEYSRRHEFRLANMNTSVRNRMYNALIAEVWQQQIARYFFTCQRFNTYVRCEDRVHAACRHRIRTIGGF